VHDVAVVFNKRSGALGAESAQPLEDSLSKLFTRRGVAPVLRAFDPATVRDDVHALLAGRPEALIVAGGDGTVRSVAEHTMRSEVPLGVLPAGTMNVLARDLGVPNDIEKALDAVLTAPVHRIDVARVNGELFLCSSALAMVPHLGRVRESARGAIGLRWLHVWARGLRIWRRYPRIRMRLVVDGREHVVRSRAVVVSNNPLSSRPAPLPRRDRLDTGRLVVYVVRDPSEWDLLGAAAEALEGSWQAGRLLRRYEGRSVQVFAPRLSLMSVMSDGEVAQLAMPLRYDIQPRALAVLAPHANS
jgi:diacylglycerol kinase family enzyme